MAKTVISTEVQWAGQGVQSTAKIRQHQVTIDEPVAWGGTDRGANPVELLLAGLGGCLNVLLTSFAPLHKVEMSRGRSTLKGIWTPKALWEGTRQCARDF